MAVPAGDPRADAVTLAITGASGAAYALRLMECLIGAGRSIYVLVSAPGQMVLSMEADLKLPGQPAQLAQLLQQRYAAAPGQIRAFGREQWTAPVASGSSAPRAMVVCPCTTGTLSAIACGASNNLIDRAADVVLKEGGKLILVPRETPLSAVHLANMLRLARLGVVILPANPGFYHRPQNVGDLVDFVVARILDQLGVEHSLVPRWGGEEGG